MRHVVGLLVLAFAIPGYDDALRCVEERKAELALGYCSRAIQSGQLPPEILAVTLTARGTAYANQGAYDQAIQDFDEAIRLNPDFALAFTNRGNAYAAKGAYDRAIQDFDQAVRLKPDNALALYNRGNAYLRNGAYDRAIQDFDHAIQLAPGSVEALVNRGMAFRRKGAYDRAIQDFDEAIRLRPGLAEAFSNRGTIYADKGAYNRALQDFDQAIRLKPDYAEAFNNRGNLYRIKGAYDRAIQDFDQAIRLKPDNALAFTNRGNAYVGKGEYDRAIQDFDEAIRRSPDYPAAASGRKLAYLTKGEHDRAIHAIQEGRLGDAIAHFQRAIESNPDARALYVGIRSVYGVRGRSLPEVGLDGIVLRQASEHIGRNDLIEAEKILTSLLRSHFANPETHLLMRRLYERRADPANAARAGKMFQGFLDAILASGDGKAPETAFLVQSISEEYFVVGSVLRCQRTQQELVFPPSGGVYDKLMVLCEDSIRSIYFDISAWLEPNPAGRLRTYQPTLPSPR
jgi:tetratricopeptide (TPR) repeat protein